MFKFKVEILLDEEKIVADHEYKPETLYTYIRDMFRQYRLKEVKTDKPNHIVFTDIGTNKDMAGLARVSISLAKWGWFRKYATKFYWYEPNKYGKIIKMNAFAEIDSV